MVKPPLQVCRGVMQYTSSSGTSSSPQEEKLNSFSQHKQKKNFFLRIKHLNATFKLLTIW